MTAVWCRVSVNRVTCRSRSFPFKKDRREEAEHNLKEGMIKPDIYEPDLNTLYAAMLKHYAVDAEHRLEGSEIRNAGALMGAYITAEQIGQLAWPNPCLGPAFDTEGEFGGDRGTEL
jgi:hypothetical protein